MTCRQLRDILGDHARCPARGAERDRILRDAALRVRFLA